MRSSKMSYMQDSDSEDELPPGWEEEAANDGTVYYFNRQHKTTYHPRTGRTKRVMGELPLGWDKSFDEERQRYVYTNQETGQSTYVDPRLAFPVEDAPLDVSRVRQRFDSSSTALQVLHGKDLKGRLAIVTGANSGIGYETARSLALHNCDVIFACRNRKLTEAAIAAIAKEKPSAGKCCRFMYVDLASLKTVQRFVQEINKEGRYIDYLILNAGIFGLSHTLTVDGLEMTFQVNHLSHFYIALHLEELFTNKTRIVLVSSESHRFSSLPTDDLTEQHLMPPKERFWSMLAYNNSKLCNVLFAAELAKRWMRRDISVFCLHPGNMVYSQVSRNWWFYRLLFALVRPFTKSLQQAAATTIYCATADELTGLSGYYFNNCFFCEPSTLSQNEKLREQLWTISERLIMKVLGPEDL